MKKPLKILMVEDNADDAELLVSELRRAGFEPEWKRVETGPAFLEEIKKSPDIIFSDYSMPQFSGLRAMELLQESGLDIPLILISGTVGEDIAVESMKKGASDYLLKDRMVRLGSSVERALEMKRLYIEQNKAQLNIENLNRVYAVLSGINEMIVREEDSQRLLDAACRIAVEKGRFRMAWIGMLNVETRRVTPVAFAGLAGDYLKQIDIDLKEDARPKGPTTMAFLTGNHAICNDIEHNPLFAPWREEALKHDYRSSAAFPIKVGGAVVGTFSLYATEPNFFDDDELRLLDELAADISFALEVHKHEAEGRRVAGELRWRTALFEAQVEASIDGILVVDSHGKKVLQNQRMNDLWQIPQSIADNPDDAEQVRFVTSRTKNPQQFAERVARLFANPNEVGRDEIELIDGTVLDRYSGPVRDKQGHHYGRIWMFRDITAHKLAEEEIRNQLKELQRWHETMLGREDRILELKREVNEQLARQHLPARYASTSQP